MYDTLVMMKSIRDNKLVDISMEDLVEEYKEFPRDEIIAELFIRNFGIIHNTINKYSKLNNENKVSWTLEFLVIALKTYSSDKKIKFLTYYISILKNALLRETYRQETNKTKIQFHTVKELKLTSNQGDVDVKTEADYEDLRSKKDFENSIMKLDFELMYKKLNLTPSEKYFLKCYLQDKTTKEIAEGWGVSTSRIHIIKNAVKKKLSVYFNEEDLVFDW